MSLDPALAQTFHAAATPPDGQTLYAVLDGASIPDLLPKLHSGPRQFYSLLPGNLGKELAAAAPYVAELLPGADLTRWLINEGWGQHWGIYAFSPAGILDVRKHFRGLFEVQDTQGKKFFFRYFDPRVFRAYLPTCTPAELNTVFGSMDQYLMEDQDPAVLLRFRRKQGALLRQEVRSSAPK